MIIRMEFLLIGNWTASQWMVDTEKYDTFQCQFGVINWSAQQFIYQLKLIKSNKVLASSRKSIKRRRLHVMRVATSLKCVSVVSVVEDINNGFKLNCSHNAKPSPIGMGKCATQGTRENRTCACWMCVCVLELKWRSFELLINTSASYHLDFIYALRAQDGRATNIQRRNMLFGTWKEATI